MASRQCARNEFAVAAGRGFCEFYQCGGLENFSRAMERHAGDFIRYLKDNLEKCAGAEEVAFAPFDPNTLAADMLHLSRAVEARCESLGLQAASPEALATCVMCGFFMTAAAVEVVGVLPVPFAGGTKARLEDALMQSRRRGVQIFRQLTPDTRRRSIAGLRAPAARAKVKTMVSMMESLSAGAGEAWEKIVAAMDRPGTAAMDRPGTAAMDRPGTAAMGRPGLKPLQAYQVYEALSAPGIPAHGYTQHMGVCVWNALQRGAPAYCLRSPRSSNLQAGAAAGLKKLAPSLSAAKLRSSAFRQAAVGKVRAGVRKEWRKHGGAAAFPAFPSEAHEISAIGAQLCAWARGGFRSTVEPKAGGYVV